MTCLCGDPECPSCGLAQGTLDAPEPQTDFCAVCDHIRELHELPFIECSHPFTPRQSSQLNDEP